MAENQYYYNTAEYREKLEELNERKQEILAEREEESKQKEKEVRLERNRLRKIFTKERCGVENIHFVHSLIDRASFLRVELEHIEQTLRVEGVLELFTQGLQTMWREHPLSKVHVQYTKNYKDVISKLESYGQSDSKGKEDESPLGDLLNRGNKAREKYKK